MFIKNPNFGTTHHLIIFLSFVREISKKIQCKRMSECIDMRTHLKNNNLVFLVYICLVNSSLFDSLDAKFEKSKSLQ